MIAASKSFSPELPPSPGDDLLIQPDQATTAPSKLQTTTAAITDDFSTLKISPSDTCDPPDIEPCTNKSDDLSNVNIPCENPNKKRKCSDCGNMDAKGHCSGCNQAPNTDGSPRISVRYCNKKCQKAHWPAHRTECKNLQARTALFRAAWLLQKIWYTVRRESFDNSIIKAEEVNGELLVHEGNYSSEPTQRENGFYRKFPDAMFKNKQDAETCLALLCCADSLSHMYMVTSWLLKDVCADSKETTVKVMKAARRSRYVSHEWAGNFLHEVLLVRLHSGERYAIDLTGAQYGFYKPITEWNEFCSSCVEVIRTTSTGIALKSPLGFNARSMLMLAFSDPWDNRTDGQRAIPMFNECLKRQFNKEFIEQVVSQHARGSDVLRLPISRFEAVEKDILLRTKQITYNTAEKIDATRGVIQSFAHISNKKMRENPEMDAALILKQALTQLAAFFNGEWARDALTGRLTSISFNRYLEDDDYTDKVNRGVLPEQKLWGDLTLQPGLMHLEPEVLAAFKASVKNI